VALVQCISKILLQFSTWIFFSSVTSHLVQSSRRMTSQPGHSAEPPSRTFTDTQAICHLLTWSNSSLAELFTTNQLTMAYQLMKLLVHCYHICSFLTPVNFLHLLISYTCSFLTPADFLHLLISYTCSFLTPVHFLYLLISNTCSFLIPTHFLHLLISYTCTFHMPAHFLHLLISYRCSFL
jgi:hypothetical protein